MRLQPHHAHPQQTPMTSLLVTLAHCNAGGAVCWPPTPSPSSSQAASAASSPASILCTHTCRVLPPSCWIPPPLCTPGDPLVFPSPLPLQHLQAWQGPPLLHLLLRGQHHVRGAGERGRPGGVGANYPRLGAAEWAGLRTACWEIYRATRWLYGLAVENVLEFKHGICHADSDHLSPLLISSTAGVGARTCVACCNTRSSACCCFAIEDVLSTLFLPVLRDGKTQGVCVICSRLPRKLKSVHEIVSFGLTRICDIQM